ncbi:MAG: DUF1688 family protein [Alphaproteobacteria bacterium]|nr:DUF1688 family protein [Alphaproteobacteria bacterium]
MDSVSYLRTPAAIRERAAQVLKYVEDGRSAWFALDAAGLEAAVQATLAVTRQRFSDPSTIPFHSRWRHFEAGGRDSRNDPLRVDAERLARLTPVELAMGFQVRGHNSLLGLEGRAELLRKLGGVGLERPGMLFDLLAQGAEGSREIKAESILAALLDRLAAIWPSRLELDGVPLGDVWRHPSVGLVPFHKLSQWMSYSLVEPLEGAGLSVVELDALTGLPEYRNGGLLVDSGALRPKQKILLEKVSAPGDEAIVEWRALTVALLDQIAAHVRVHLKMDARSLPLVKVLEAGTWFAGRTLAAQRRKDGGPPIAVQSDGTVF